MNKNLVIGITGVVIVTVVIGTLLIRPETISRPPAPTRTPSEEEKPTPGPTPGPTPSPLSMIWGLVWEYKTDYPIKGVAVSPDGNYIAAVGDNYEGGRKDVLYLLTKEGSVLWEKVTRGWIYDVSVCRNGAYIGVASDYVYLLNGSGEVVWKKEEYYGQCFISISENSEYVLVGSYHNGWIYLLNNDGEVLWKHRALGSVTSVSISSNGEYIVVADSKGYVYFFDGQGNLLWDKKTGENSFHATYVSVSPDGRFIGIGMNLYHESDRIALLNKEGGWLLNPKEVEHLVDSISITSTGELLFIPAGKEGLCVYDMNGEFISSFKARERVFDIANTPDGTYLILGSDDMRVYLLEKSYIASD